MKILKALGWVMVLIGVGLTFTSCSKSDSDEKLVPTDIVFSHASSDQQLSAENGTLTVNRFLVIRVLDQNGDELTDTPVYVKYDVVEDDPDDGIEPVEVEEILIEPNRDGLRVVDPTGHFRLTVRADTKTEDYLLNTEGLISLDPDQPGDFDGEGTPEYMVPPGTTGPMTFLPGQILGVVPEGVEIYHILYLFEPPDTRSETARVAYGGIFTLELGDYSDVDKETTYVFKSTLAIVENGKITYETPLSQEVTVLIHPVTPGD